jgi:polyhydroxybutyrate depolymerase
MFCFISAVVMAEEAQPTFKDRLKAKFKERLTNKMEEKAAPVLSSGVEGVITKPGDYILSLTHNEIYRFYKLHIPASYSANKPHPLLFSFHGGGGDMTIQSNDKFYKLISKSEKEGFIVVFPNGYSKFKSGKLATWNAGNCCGEARDQNIDDVGFVKAILLELKKKISIDEKQIYSIGMSNGAMLSYRLACQMSDVFTGIAAVAGSDNTQECVPKKPISILHIHAKDDDHVLFNGGIGKGAVDKKYITNFTSVPNTIAKWVNLNGCDKNSMQRTQLEGAYCEEYTKCRENVKVKLCVTDAGKHSWPGGEKPRGNSEPSKAISANEVMWSFFQHK